jgi:hypothetical protein
MSAATSERMGIQAEDIFIDRVGIPAHLSGSDLERWQVWQSWAQVVLDTAVRTGEWPEGLPVVSERTHTRGPQGERYALIKFEPTGEQNKELIRVIRAEKRETYGTTRLRSRIGRCHEIAERAIIFGATPPGTVMLQGTCILGDGNPQAREYSWLELPDGRTWDPVACRYDYLRAVSMAGRYDHAEAIQKSNETDICGWWSGSPGTGPARTNETEEA